MKKREIAWIVALLLLIGAYIHYFSNWGEKREIQVVATIRPVMQGRRRGGVAPNTNAPVYRVLFALDTYYRLTSVAVSEVDKKNPNAMGRDLWHLVSTNSSPPMRTFTYGQAIQNMEPEIPEATPEPLTPGGIYRVEVSAGSLTGVSTPFTVPAGAK